MFDNQPSHGCNGFADLCCSSLMWVIFGATGLLLFFSLTCNILCFARTYRKDHSSKLLPRFRRSFSFKSKEVEDPVYGNINYIYTGLERHSNGQSEGPKTGLKGNTPRQICYAKLELPASRDQQGRRLTKTQYAETLNMLKKSRVDRKAQQGVLENQANTTLSRTLPKFPDSQDLEPSEFYASVHLGKPDSTARSEQYANNESLKI